MGPEQKAVATRIGVTAGTVYNWENGRTEPEGRFFPPLIEFIGYNPLPTPRHGVRRSGIEDCYLGCPRSSSQSTVMWTKPRSDASKPIDPGWARG